MLAEAAGVHRPGVERRLALGDPLRHQLAHPARAREAVGAEAGGDEEAAHGRLAEQELAVGRERLRAVDQLRDRHLVHHRHAAARVDRDLLEAVPVLLEQAAVEVGGDRVDAAGVERPRRRVALVAAHHEPAGVLAEVDEEVGVAHGREVLVAESLAERLGDEVLVRHRHERDAHARHAADLGREHAAGVDHHLGLDVPAVGLDAAHAAAGDVDRGHARVGVDVAAALARALGERVGQQARVEVAVGRQPRGAEHAVGGHEREALLRLLGGEQLERQPERLRPARLAARLLPALGRGRQPQPAALDPAAVERPVELDRVHHHPRQRHRAAQLPDEPRRVERRAGRQLRALDEHHVLPAQLGEVVGDRAAAHAPADDHAAGGPG